MGGGLQVGVCTWIGLHIDSINTELQDCLQACQGCYHAWQQCPVQIFAVPFRGDARLNGLCNLHSVPPTILLDVGRVVPQDWLAVVAHEYAHAQVGVPGHEQLFFKVMTHLCLGLGLSAPPAWPDDRLCHWPPVRRPLEGTDFWLGHPGSCALPVTEYYSQSKKGEGIP